MARTHRNPLDELDILAEGRVAKVIATKRVGKGIEEYRRRMPNHVGRLNALMKKFADLGRETMPENDFKFEERLRDGNGGKIAIYAFKPFKFRVYGGLVHHNGKETFVATETAEKKQDKADRDCLELAARRLGELTKTNQ